MRRTHINPTQKLDSPTGFLPILQNEVPFFRTLNRPAQTAYTYAEDLSRLLSYTGAISILPSGGTDVLGLYSLVRLTDSDTVVKARPTDSRFSRYGIVVEAQNEEGMVTIVTFNPNFIYPYGAITTNIKPGTTLSVGTPLYLAASGSNIFSLSAEPTNTDSGTSIQIGAVPIGVITGTNSMFFCGATRGILDNLVSAASAPTIIEDELSLAANTVIPTQVLHVFPDVFGFWSTGTNWPEWLKLDSFTGKLSGTADVISSYNATVHYRTPASTSTKTITINVS